MRIVIFFPGIVGLIVSIRLPITYFKDGYAGDLMKQTTNIMQLQDKVIENLIVFERKLEKGDTLL